MRVLSAAFLVALLLCWASAQDAGDDQTVLGSAASEFDYQSDAARLLKVVSAHLYHDTSAFLRELVSNSADALEKFRMLRLTESIQDDAPLNVTIRSYKDEAKLVIADAGLGMTREELQSNLGTIAKSGTTEFLDKVTSSSGEQASTLIGRFGLGFYSSFLVADKVSVASKSYKSDEQWVFESSLSDASSRFKIFKDPRGNTLGSRGTEIILYLNKEAAAQYIDPSALMQLVKQQAEFATGDAPIFVWNEVKAESAEESEDAKEASAEPASPWVRVNDKPPIWMRDPKAISDEEYKGFYQAAFEDAGASEALLWSHFKGDAGATEFRGLIYMPTSFSQDIYQQTYQALNTLRLYVRRVFITSDLGTTFIPKWLNWLKVIVDADDLPLNVGRDSLQNNPGVALIKRTVLRKAIDMIVNAAKKDPEHFTEEIWPVVGSSLKIGTLEDFKNQPKLLKVLRWQSSATTGESATLDDYVSRRKQGQNQIYFIAGAGQERADLEKSPFVENIIARGYEVLFFTEPLDEMIAGNVKKFEGMPFQDVAKEGLKYGDEDDQAEQASLASKFDPLAKFLQTKLSDAVKKVVVSSRLTTSPCAIVAEQGAWTGNMERLVAAQNSRQGGRDEDFMKQYMKMQKKILEINPTHPLVEALLERVTEYEGDDEAAQKDGDLDETVSILYDTSLVRSGFNVREPSSYFTRVESILRRSLGVSESAKAKVNVKPAPPVEEGPYVPAPEPEQPGAMPNFMDFGDFKSQFGDAAAAAEPDSAASVEHDEL